MTVPHEGEMALLPPLLAWLERHRRIRSDTVLALELPWFGRRVDFVTLTATRRTTAYEFKLGDNRRAIEQAAYNALSFDSSYVVTGTMPSPELIELAERHDVGMIVIHSDSEDPVTIVRAAGRPWGGSVRKRLLTAIRELGIESAHV